MLRNFVIIHSFVASLAFVAAPAFANKEISRKVIVLGDSLSEGYGVNKEKAYPNLLETLLHEAGYKNTSIQNAGISGSTSSSGLSRLKWLMRSKPTHLLLELGGNDGLRGINLDITKRNLDEIITFAQDNGLKVMLLGMRIPPNYGQEYTTKFETMYKDLATAHKLPSIPFLLRGVAGDPKLNLPDGIHPNEAGHALVAKHILSSVIEFIER